MPMLDTAWRTIKDAVDAFISRPSPQPPFIGTVAPADGSNLVAGRAFVPEASYFSVRLVEMRLAEGGKYFTEFLPLGVCVAEYTYGAERRRVPLVLNNETIKQMLGDSGGQPGHVHFANMPVVRWAPMKEDNLALFVGLFRMPYTDIARSVLQLAADVSTELGGVAFGAGTRVAAKLYDRVADIFALSTVQPRFAFLDGAALTKSGYMLVSGPLPEDIKGADFVVENGRLRLHDRPTQSLDAFDYCLVAIEQRDSLLFPPSDAKPTSAMLGALAGLPFHERWRGVASLLARRKAAEAEEALLTLRAEVVASPDLTEEDRLIAIAGYDVAYEQYERPLLAKPGGAGPITRGFRSGTPVAGLKSVATARKELGDNATATALNEIALRLQEAQGGASSAPSEENADQVLAEAFSGMRAAMVEARAQGLRAASLSNALSVAMAPGRDI
jgi:hypothetical protein